MQCDPVDAQTAQQTLWDEARRALVETQEEGQRHAIEAAAATERAALELAAAKHEMRRLQAAAEWAEARREAVRRAALLLLDMQESGGEGPDMAGAPRQTTEGQQR